MKILLIKPSNLNTMNNSISHPLGLMYLASFIRKERNNKDDIKIYDMRIYSSKNAEKKLLTLLSTFEPDIVGISSIIVEYRKMFKVARIAKSLLKNVIIIAGGPYPTAYPEETLECGDIDCIVRGEGEYTFYQLIEKIENGKGFRNVKGVGFKKDNSITLSPPSEFIKNIDHIPYPAWDLIEIEKYAQFKSRNALGRGRYMSVYTSRGCPFDCIYCHNIFGKEFRPRSVENVLGEIKYLIRNYHITEFEIIDDVFNFNKARASNFFNEIIRRKLNITLLFPNGLRVDLLDEDLLLLMKKAGVSSIVFAVESGSLRIQKLINKNLNLNKIKRLIPAAGNLHIYVTGFFMLGFPTETKEEMNMTVNFALKSHLPEAHFFITIPFKCTKLGNDYSQMREKLLHPDNFDYFQGSFNLSSESDRTLFWTQRMAYVRFYFSIRRFYYYYKSFPYSKILFPKVLSRRSLRFLRWFFSFKNLKRNSSTQNDRSVH